MHRFRLNRVPVRRSGHIASGSAWLGHDPVAVVQARSRLHRTSSWSRSRCISRAIRPLRNLHSHLLFRPVVQRTSRMLRQRLLLHGEGHGLRRGRHFRYYRPCNHRPGRHRFRRTCIHAKNTGPRGRNRRPHANRRAVQLVLGNPDCVPAYRLRIYQYRVRNRGNCAGHGLVRILDV